MKLPGKHIPISAEGFILFIIILIFSSNPARAQIFDIGGNAAALPALALDAGIGISLGKGHTLSAEALARPIYPDRIFYLRAVCRKYRTPSNTGPFIGISGGYLNFAGSDRYGEGITLGTSIGYRFILSKRIDLSLEAGATLAAVRDSLHISVSDPWAPDLEETRKILYLMPFPISINIYYRF